MKNSNKRTIIVSACLLWPILVFRLADYLDVYTGKNSLRGILILFTVSLLALLLASFLDKRYPANKD